MLRQGGLPQPLSWLLLLQDWSLSASKTIHPSLKPEMHWFEERWNDVNAET